MLDQEGRNGDEGRNCKGVRMGRLEPCAEEAVSKLGHWLVGPSRPLLGPPSHPALTL